MLLKTAVQIINNIYDLRGNEYTWTSEKSDLSSRICRLQNYEYGFLDTVRYEIYLPTDIIGNLRQQNYSEYKIIQ